MARSHHERWRRTRLLAIVFGLSPAARAATWELGSSQLELTASWRDLRAVATPRDNVLDTTTAVGLTQLRLNALASVASNRLSLEAQAVQAYGFASEPQSFSEFLTLGPQRYRITPLSSNWGEAATARAIFGMDRLVLRLSSDVGNVYIGRQAINFSETNFWSALDLFLPFGPRVVDTEYKAGVDAIRLNLPLADTAMLDLVAAAGAPLEYDVTRRSLVCGHCEPDIAWSSSALIARVALLVGSTNVALQGGAVAGGYHVGVGASGELFGRLGVRVEAAYLHRRGLDPVSFVGGAGVPSDFRTVRTHVRSTVGVERRFENDVYLAVEYAYNGSLEGDLTAASLRAAVGEATNFSPHLVGAVLSYSLLPTLVGRLAGVLALPDASALATPSLSWEALEDFEVLSGAVLAVGPHPQVAPSGLELRSEFGSFPSLIYVLAKYYF